MDLSKHLEKAEDAIKRRNYKLATGICHQLLGFQPDSGEARACLRKALFKKVEVKPPSKVTAWIGGGVHLLTLGLSRMMGKHAAAARAAERYLVLDPLSEGVNLKLGDSLVRAGCRKSALAVYRAYAEAHPRCLEACRQAGSLLYEAGELGPALEMYENALKVDPRDQESLKARKNLAAEGALRSTGIEKAKSSRELIRDAEATRKVERGDRLQLSKEEIGEELDEIEAKLGERPNDLKLLARAAQLRRMDDDLEGALDCLERALQVAPEKSDLAEQAGDLRLRIQDRRVRQAEERGDDGTAERAREVLGEMRIAEFRRRVEQHPTDFGLRYDLGEALLLAGQTDAAVAELQQAIKDPRKKGDALLLLGRAFRKKEMGELALGQLQKALDAVGGSGRKGLEIIYEMGCVAEENGDPAAALSHFSRILEQDIGYRDVAQKVDQLKSSKP